jgi:glycosyltransferase involved in cell wall biosynthesis
VREGFGWPIIEAQASGGVVITSDRAPMNEIGGDCAIYCTPPPEDGKGFDEWSRQVAEQTLQPALQMTANQRNWHVENGIDNAANYSADKMCDSYEMLYRECIKRFN